MDIGAAETNGLRDDPLEEGAGVACAPSSRQRDQVVDIDGSAEGEVGRQPEARRRYHEVIYERRDDSIALSALGVDQSRDVVRVAVRPQLVHHVRDERTFARLDLADHAATSIS
jgi:hypothetical protein